MEKLKSFFALLLVIVLVSAITVPFALRSANKSGYSISELMTQRQNAETRLAFYQGRVSDLIAHAGSLGCEIDTLLNLISDSEDIQVLQSKLDKIAELNKVIAEQQAIIALIPEGIDLVELVTHIQMLSDAIDELTIQIEQLEQAINQLEAENDDLRQIILGHLTMIASLMTQQSQMASALADATISVMAMSEQLRILNERISEHAPSVVGESVAILIGNMHFFMEKRVTVPVGWLRIEVVGGGGGAGGRASASNTMARAGGAGGASSFVTIRMDFTDLFAGGGAGSDGGGSDTATLPGGAGGRIVFIFFNQQEFTATITAGGAGLGGSTSTSGSAGTNGTGDTRIGAVNVNAMTMGAHGRVSDPVHGSVGGGQNGAPATIAGNTPGLAGIDGFVAIHRMVV